MLAGERLSLVQGDRLYRVARIIALAIDAFAFEDKTSALEWLDSKTDPPLSAAVSLSTCSRSPQALRKVENLLYRLKNP